MAEDSNVSNRNGMTWLKTNNKALRGWCHHNLPCGFFNGSTFQIQEEDEETTGEKGSTYVCIVCENIFWTRDHANYARPCRLSSVDEEYDKYMNLGINMEPEWIDPVGNRYPNLITGDPFVDFLVKTEFNIIGRDLERKRVSHLQNMVNKVIRECSLEKIDRLEKEMIKHCNMTTNI